MAKKKVSRPTREVLLAKVRKLFPKDERAEALEALEKYGVEEHQREPVRVRLAILKLAGGNLKLLRGWVRIAKEDYRDVLASAEYPEQMRVGPLSDDLGRALKADREQYLAWLRDV